MRDLVPIFIDTLTPVFLVIGVGFFLGPRLEIDARSMARAAYYVFAPAFIFQILSNAALEAGVVIRIIAVLGLTSVIAGLVALGLGRALRRPAKVVATSVCR